MSTFLSCLTLRDYCHEPGGKTYHYVQPPRHRRIDDEWFTERLAKGELFSNAPSTPEPPSIDRISAIEKARPAKSIPKERTEAPPRDTTKTKPCTNYSATKRQLMKPGEFDGSGSLESFLRKFEVCSDHKQWTEKEKADFLQSALEKSASQLLWDFGSKANITYEGLSERLRQR